MADPVAVVDGVVRFLVLVAVGVLAGTGLLSAAGILGSVRERAQLAPLAITVFWTLLVGIPARSGIAIRHLAAGAWGVTGLLALYGVWRLLRAPGDPGTRARPALDLALAAAPVLVVGAPYFLDGLTAHLGTPNLDTVVYTVLASHYWEFGAAAPVEAPPYFQDLAASKLSRLLAGRSSTYVLLAFLSPLVEPGEPMLVRNVFACWTLLVLASTLSFFATAPGLGRAVASPPVLGLGRRALHVSVALLVGWAAVPALVGNWDNALATAVGPAIAGLALRWTGGARLAPMLGAVGAYAVYTYTELAPLLLLFALPLLGWTGERAGAARAPRLDRGHVVAAVVCLALVAPGLPALGHYLSRQLAAARAAPAGSMRPGGLFAAGLLTGASPAGALWGLGPEHRIDGAAPAESAVAAGLTLCLAVGIGAAGLRRGQRALLGSLALVAAVAAYFALVDHYAYAVYKVLGVSWWLVSWFAVEGALASAGAVGAPSGPPARRLAWSVVAGGLALLALTATTFTGLSRVARYSAAPVRARQPAPATLRTLARVLGGERADSVLVRADDLSLPWVIYALRHTPFRLYHAPGAPLPVPGARPWVATAAPDLVVRQVPPWVGARARLASFAYGRPSDGPMIEAIESPNGVEAWGTWLGPEPARIAYVAAAPGLGTLLLELRPGPSIPRSARRTLEILDGRDSPVGQFTVTGPGRVCLPLALEPGRHAFGLRAADPPTRAVLPNGDRRPLVVGLRDLRLLAPGAACDAARTPTRGGPAPTSTVGR
jgi:hypothetical protein